MDRTPVRLMWTGGWDSTFQLMRLLLVHGVFVEPIYVVDTQRRSLQTELQTMDRIRERLAKEHPQTRELLMPTLFADISDLAPDEEIENAWRRLVATTPIGTQYSWLARFCKQRGLDEVEIGAEYTYHGAGQLMTDRVKETQARYGHVTWRLPRNETGDDLGMLFGAYSLPLARTTKWEMHKEATQRNWTSIMGETWFCHRPVRGQPCGTCNPCQSVIDEGMEWRIPPNRRAVAMLHRATVRPVKKTAKRLVQKFRGAYLTPPPAVRT